MFDDGNRTTTELIEYAIGAQFTQKQRTIIAAVVDQEVARRVRERTAPRGRCLECAGRGWDDRDGSGDPLDCRYCAGSGVSP